ncbi:Scr1 family TA system antitoxin-like transcriptional regulator [Actinopolymorpha sp. B9G3]|uniref:Scr1 family TA system antitoxin-like transcriptional regulator n=1 Tax=Actinopolymorpha sp. B9G3 TaxID=3158970 RepID=UPI0032D96EE6
MQRQQVLSDPDRSIRILVWEAALHMVMCPIDVMVAQLDRLAGAVGISRTPLGIVPLGVPLTAVPGHCFWIFDERLVRIETTAAELRLTETSEIATYVEAWQRLEGAAAFGPAAHRIIARARVALDNSNGE